jgi:hypothetical protein
MSADRKGKLNALDFVARLAAGVHPDRDLSRELEQLRRKYRRFRETFDRKRLTGKSVVGAALSLADIACLAGWSAADVHWLLDF